MHVLDVSSTPPTWAGIITAASTLVIALTALVGGLTALIKVLLPIKNATVENTLALAEVKTAAAANETAVAEVHTMVNQQRSDMQAQLALQQAVLRYHGIEPPVLGEAAPLAEHPVSSEPPGNDADGRL